MKKVNGGVETHALQRFRGQYFPDVPEAAAREILRACKKGLGERTGTIFITRRTCREAGYAEYAAELGNSRKRCSVRRDRRGCRDHGGAYGRIFSAKE